MPCNSGKLFVAVDQFGVQVMVKSFNTIGLHYTRNIRISNVTSLIVVHVNFSSPHDVTKMFLPYDEL